VNIITMINTLGIVVLLMWQALGKGPTWRRQQKFNYWHNWSAIVSTIHGLESRKPHVSKLWSFNFDH